MSTASALGLALQDSALVACKDIALQAIPKHVSAVELHLESSEMGSPGGCASVMCNGCEASTSSNCQVLA